MQEHSLVLAVPALPALVSGVVAARIMSRKLLGSLCALAGGVGIAAAILPLAQAWVIRPGLEAQLRSTLGTDYDLRAMRAPVRNPSSPFDLVTWLNIPTVEEVPVQTEEVVYSAEGGLELHMDVYLADEEGPRPLLLLIHGGGLVGGNRGDVRNWAVYYAGQGYLAAAVEYRLAPASYLPEPLHDAQRAVLWLRDRAVQYGADPRWVGVIGFSSGGHLALLLGYAGAMGYCPPGALAGDCGVEAVVAVAPVTDLAFYSPDVLGRGSVEDAPGGPPLSPMELAAAGRPSPPVMIVQGLRDPVVRHEQTDRFVAAAQGHNPIVYVQIPWGGHLFHVMPGGLGTQVSRYLIDRFLAWSQTENPFRQ